MDNMHKDNWNDPKRVCRMAQSYSRRYGELFWQAMNNLLGPTPLKCIVDFGCGSGLFLLDAINHFNAHIVYGVDASNEMLDVARRNFESISKRVEFKFFQLDLDSGDIPVAPESADLVFSGYVLHEVRKPTKLLQNAKRLLRPNGYCVVFDYVSGNEEAFVQKMTTSGMDEADARKRYFHMCKHSLTDIVRLLEKSGFHKIRYAQIDESRVIVIGIKG